MSGRVEAAASNLSVARSLIESHSTSDRVRDEKFAALELFLDYEDANLSWLRGDNLETTLRKFEAAIKKHGLGGEVFNRSAAPKDQYSRDFYESTQIRRAFILADLGRWKETLPILEEIRSPREYREGVAYYLGHCYLAAQDYVRAEQKLNESLRFGGLPSSLESRAHCELGMAYYQLSDYRQAKRELERGAKMADKAYLSDGVIWRWLELTCRALGLKEEAEQYARRVQPS
jgi:tetratricopeptide (TPR) repeat protein